MPSMADPTAAGPIKMLCAGDSGNGKTGALASLVAAGYKLYIADYDGGLEILRNILLARARAEKKPDTFYLSRVDFETCKDPYEIQGAHAVPKASVAWTKGIKYMHACLNKGLGLDDILVMDSLSFAARTAMIYQLHLNNRLKSPPWQNDWGDAQRLVERAVDMITGNTPCHFIATAHVAYSGGKEKVTVKDADGSTRVEVIDNGPEVALPAMVGQAINGVIPRYFNHLLLFRQVGTGAATQRRIHTTTIEGMALKNTNPGVIKPDYPLATGLADYFRDARGSEPSQAAKAA